MALLAKTQSGNGMIHEQVDFLQQLIGTWEGFGHAEYPTIAPTRYREVLIFRVHPDKPMLQVEQKTWRQHADLSESLLHWEFGFIRQAGEVRYDWTNTQNNGRVEVMHGHFGLDCQQVIGDFSTETFANDPRMIEATRRLVLDGEQLRYTLSMATDAHTSLRIHLEANLHRTINP